MRIGLIIADFEMRYTVSFQHTARVKYNVDFNSSNIAEIQQNLYTLKNSFNNPNDVPVGYDFELEDIERIEMLLDRIINHYKDTFKFKTLPEKKIYRLIDEIQQSEQPDPKQIAKEAVEQLLHPPVINEKLTKKARIKAEAEKLSLQRGLRDLKKKPSLREDF